MTSVIFSQRARADLVDIWAWIARASGEALADDIIDRIASRISALGDHPQLGPARPEIADSARSLVCERWLVLYRIEDRAVHVVRVIDAARDIRRIDWPEAD